MSNIKQDKQSIKRITSAIVLIGAIWIASDLGYYFLLPALGAKVDYNVGPVAISLYYIFWVGLSTITFWPLYATWPRYSHWATFGNRFTSALIWAVSFVAALMFAIYILPGLPPFKIPEGVNPPALPLATSWYFLPKSVDILFQQLLVLALVLIMAQERQTLKTISTCCGILFGLTHMLLAFGDVPWLYVIRFVILGSVFGMVFPYLILRVRNGFAYSYITHWTYYAITVLSARAIRPLEVAAYIQ